MCSNQRVSISRVLNFGILKVLLFIPILSDQKIGEPLVVMNITIYNAIIGTVSIKIKKITNNISINFFI